jgi:HAD superfamily hydrolase (TIGR01450 family)
MTKNFGIDLDGVVWAGSALLQGAQEAIGVLRSKGNVRFLTNNSAKTKPSIVDKFKGLGVSVAESEIYTSGYAALDYAKKSGFKKINLVADAEIKKLYLENGFDVQNQIEDVAAVVVHFSRQISYDLLALCTHQVINGATLIGCNRDRIFPADGGRLMPGCGPFLTAIEVASNVEAKICGKPSQHFLQKVLDELACTSDSFYMIGDSVESDIVMGKSLSTKTVLIHSSGSDIVDDRLTRPDIACDSLLKFANLI